MEKPDFCTDEMLEYLDGLRESGATNMFGARPPLMEQFEGLSRAEAGKVLAYWMATFATRHGDE